MSEQHLHLSHTFNYPWRVVARAYLCKYPHRKLSHVESVDTLERYVDGEGRLVTTRILLSSFLRISNIIGHEESVVDLESQTICLKTTNATHQHLAATVETCEYRADNEHSTLYELKATVVPTFGMGLFVGFLFKTIQGNFLKGRKVLEDIIVNQLGHPWYNDITQFSEEWHEKQKSKDKLKMLKKAVADIEILRTADFTLISDIIKTLSKYQSEVDVIAGYVKSFADWHSIEKLTLYLSDCDRILVKELISSLKEAYGRDFFEDLKLKYGIS